MPYIPKPRREAAATEPETVGELTYAVQQVLKGYLDRKGRNYQNFAECLAALHGAGLDMWDRRMAPYEHSKKYENGDVW